MNMLKPAISMLALLSLAACTDDADTVNAGAATGAQAEQFSEFVAVIHPTDGNEISGVVLFSNTDEGVRVGANINGLPPMSSHGFHIHEFGDCSAADGTSAGGHFNPHAAPHGAREGDQRHVGDLGNVVSNGAGVAQVNFVDDVLSFDGMDSIIGRAVVIHAGQDDLQTQPTGDAGARLACGVIGVAQQQ